METIPLQAKVHIQKGEELAVFGLLKERGVGRWVPTNVPFQTSQGPLLNGLFGVEKPGKLSALNKPVLRVIMNLVLANNVLGIIKGDISFLPNATSWLPLVLDEGTVTIFTCFKVT